MKKYVDSLINKQCNCTDKFIWITFLWGTFQAYHSLKNDELKWAVEDRASKTAKRLEK